MVDDTRGELLHRSALLEWPVRCGHVPINHYTSGMSENAGHMGPRRYLRRLMAGYADPNTQGLWVGGVGGGAENIHNVQKWTTLREKVRSSLQLCPWFLGSLLLISAPPRAQPHLAAGPRQEWIIVGGCLSTGQEGSVTRWPFAFLISVGIPGMRYNEMSVCSAAIKPWVHDQLLRFTSWAIRGCVSVSRTVLPHL